ncbi:MAG: hypothetical protein IJH71_08975 [Eubacterium sp.]|nr:hypothetical protein [Eubacterium sp.]
MTLSEIRDRKNHYSISKAVRIIIPVLLLLIAAAPLKAAQTGYRDLTLVRGDTRPMSARWIQSFAFDGNCYYYVQMTDPSQGNLMLTRVRYDEMGVHKDYMRLNHFGHGTNLDCSVYMGSTWLWIGCEADRTTGRTQAVTCFRYCPGRTLDGHGEKVYYFCKNGRGGKLTGRRASNIFPAVSDDGKWMAIRYTSSRIQHFQIFSLVNGTDINPAKPVESFSLTRTDGPFQGFDIQGDQLATIEGSARASLLRTLGRGRRYRPTRVVTYNIRTKRLNTETIAGAAALTFREPEGIKLYKDGNREMMFISGTLFDQKCNVYTIR